MAEMNTITSTRALSGQNANTSFKSSPLNKSHNKNRFFYTIGSFNFLLEESIKVENLYEFTINRVPHAPEWCSGVISIRGNIMPVVNMHVFLKTGINIDAKQKKLIMLEHEHHSPIVFEIDKLPEVVSPDHYTSVQVLEKSPLWLTKTLKNETNTIHEINHSELLRQLKNS